MKQVTCEYIVWQLLPVLRKEIALSMIKNFGLSKKETSQKLGISQAAISQYLSGKRGKIHITDVKIIEEINISAKKIIKQGDKITASEICRLCKIFLSKQTNQNICNSCKDENIIIKNNRHF